MYGGVPLSFLLLPYSHLETSMLLSFPITILSCGTSSLLWLSSSLLSLSLLLCWPFSFPHRHPSTCCFCWCFWLLRWSCLLSSALDVVVVVVVVVVFVVVVNVVVVLLLCLLWNCSHSFHVGRCLSVQKVGQQFPTESVQYGIDRPMVATESFSGYLTVWGKI